MKKVGAVLAVLSLLVVMSGSALADTAFHTSRIEGFRAYSRVKNQYGDSRYYSNYIFQTASPNVTTDGTSIASSNNTLSAGTYNEISAVIASYPNVYTRGIIYKGAISASGVSRDSKIVLKPF